MLPQVKGVKGGAPFVMFGDGTEVQEFASTSWCFGCFDATKK